MRGSVGVASTLISLCVASEEEKSGRRAGRPAGWTAIGGTGSEHTTTLHNTTQHNPGHVDIQEDGGAPESAAERELRR